MTTAADLELQTRERIESEIIKLRYWRTCEQIQSEITKLRFYATMEDHPRLVEHAETLLILARQAASDVDTVAKPR